MQLKNKAKTDSFEKSFMNKAGRRMRSYLHKGFTLVEMMLVLIIISMLIWASIGYMQKRTDQLRIDKMVMQMQQILNAGLAYYVANGHWPEKLDDLVTGGYLPVAKDAKLINPWGQEYNIVAYSPDPAKSPSILYVYAPVITVSKGTASAIAQNIAGVLPLSYTSVDPGKPGPDSPTPPSNDQQKKACLLDPAKGATTCQVVTGVNIPGQNLNNATSFSYGAVYNNGGCVPAPECPLDTNQTDPTKQILQPEIYVTPVSVSGFSDATGTNVYPITSFTAYAKGKVVDSKVVPVLPPDQPDGCEGATNSQPVCAKDPNAPNVRYWRVCLSVVTEHGQVNSQNNNWGKNVSLMAITRCALPDQNTGSGQTGTNIFSN